jgi:hypothetical protein
VVKRERSETQPGPMSGCEPTSHCCRIYKIPAKANGNKLHRKISIIQFKETSQPGMGMNRFVATLFGSALKAVSVECFSGIPLFLFVGNGRKTYLKVILRSGGMAQVLE